MKKRKCIRFPILKASIRLNNDGHSLSHSVFGEGPYPVFDLSREGLQFLANKRFELNTRVLIELSLPEDASFLFLYGKFRWIRRNPGRSYSHQIGIQFSPFGREKGQNSIRCLEKLAWIESCYIAPAG